MNNFFKNLFNKPDEDLITNFTNSNINFVIKINNLPIGYLKSENNVWKFEYSEDFRGQNKYHRLVGFRDLNKMYSSVSLWPFFKIRIPGLKQPIVKEKIKIERIDIKDEAILLKIFGKKSMANPYILEQLHKVPN